MVRRTFLLVLLILLTTSWHLRPKREEFSVSNQVPWQAEQECSIIHTPNEAAFGRWEVIAEGATRSITAKMLTKQYHCREAFVLNYAQCSLVPISVMGCKMCRNQFIRSTCHRRFVSNVASLIPCQREENRSFRATRFASHLQFRKKEILRRMCCILLWMFHVS